jgi:hypothetical protein
MNITEWTIPYAASLYRSSGYAGQDHEFAARVLMWRTFGLEWGDIAERLDTAASHAQQTASKMADRLNVREEWDEVCARALGERHARMQLRGQCLSPDTTIDNLLEMRSAARIAWRLGAVRGGTCVGSPSRVAERLHLGSIWTARDTLMRLDTASIVRWSEFHTPSGDLRWSVGLRQVAR